MTKKTVLNYKLRLLAGIKVNCSAAHPSGGHRLNGMIGELGDSSRNFFHLAALIQLGLPRGAACHPQKHHSSNHHRENLSNPHAATVPLPCRLARFMGSLRPLLNRTWE